MKPLIVISYATKRAGLLDIYERQLADAGIDFYLCPILPLTTWEQLSTIGFTIGMVREMLDRFKDYEHIVFTDAHDMLFFGTQEEVMGKLDRGNILLLQNTLTRSAYYPILMAAEKNCFPDPTVADKIKGDTPWRYANGGCFAGSHAALTGWIDYLERMVYAEAINQEAYNDLLAEGLNLNFQVDSHTRLFYCMYKDAGELIRKIGRPWNQVTGTRPCWIHFNGKTDPSGFLKEYGL